MAAKTLRLSPELEKSLLAGVICGAVPIETVQWDELSGDGRLVYKAAADLILAGQATPLPLQSVLLALSDVYGVQVDKGKAILESIRAMYPSAEGAEAVVRKLREKHALLAVANGAALQLQRGEYNPQGLMEIVAANATAGPPAPLSESIKDGLPGPVPRLELGLLPGFSQRIGGGLVGLTVVAGEPAVGKSTLAWQAALDVGRKLPVLYYDLDNGVATLLDRTRQMIGDDLAAIREATQRIFLRDGIRTLESDTIHIPAPALVVVDIFQALPTPQEFERQGLGHWIHRLGALRRRGYHVLVVSEVQRAAYGNPSLSAFKGSGEIEYTADLALQMVGTRNGAELHIVKNRHGERKGIVATLERERGFVWRELQVDERPWESPDAGRMEW